MAKKSKNHTNPNRKTRSVLQIVYEDSAPSNWREQMKAEVDNTDSRLEWFLVSPLQCYDSYTEEDEKKYWERQKNFTMTDEDMKYPVKAGEYKKPHWHTINELTNPIQLIYSDRYLKSLTNGFNVVPREDLRGAVRYLAHLDEDPTKKTMYNPDEIFAYGSIVGKYEKFLEDEDKSMGSLTAWYAIEDLIDKYNITSYYDFEKMIREQDISLQLQFQKNARLAHRTALYINSRREEFAKRPPSEKALDRAIARQNLDKLVEKGVVTLAYAEQQIQSLYQQIEGGKKS